MRRAVSLAHSYRLLNHGPTTLIASSHAGRRNVMAAAWVMPLDFDPPKLAAVIAADTWTRELVEASGEFTVCVPTTAQADLTLAVGSLSGRDVDKFARFHLDVEPAAFVSAPLVGGCAAWLECRVVPEAGIAERHDLFLAEVVAAWADDALYRDGEWRFAADGPRTIHHLKGGLFFATGERIRASKP